MCDNFVIYEKIKKKYGTVNYIKGKEVAPGKVHKWIGYNLFEKRLSNVPKTFQKQRLKKYEKDQYCGNKKRIDEIDFDKNIHSGCEKYIIKYNYENPFVVCIKQGILNKLFKNKVLSVYRMHDNIFFDDYPEAYVYDQLVLKTNFDHVFVPKGYELTGDSDNPVYENNGDNGNTILAKVKDKYIYISNTIYEFKPKDEIVTYYSPFGGNFVPYPVAFGKKYVYFMLDQTYLPIKYFEKLSTDEKINAYSYYYGYSGKTALKKYAKKMKGVKKLI